MIGRMEVVHVGTVVDLLIVNTDSNHQTGATTSARDVAVEGSLASLFMRPGVMGTCVSISRLVGASVGSAAASRTSTVIKAFFERGVRVEYALIGRMEYAVEDIPADLIMRRRGMPKIITKRQNSGRLRTHRITLTKDTVK